MQAHPFSSTANNSLVSATSLQMPHPTKSSVPSESDLAVNRALLAHAELQRNVKRFLGLVPASDAHGNGRAGGQDGGGDRGDDGDVGSDKDFVAENETAGLTLAPPTAAATAQAQALRSDEKLRRQLLGKRSKDLKLRHRHEDPGLKASKPRPLSSQATKGSDEDEDEGRSSLGGKARRKKAVGGGQAAAGSEAGVDGDGATGASEKVQVPPLAAGSGKKRPGSYLDEILAERAAKKRKKEGKEQAAP